MARKYLVDPAPVMVKNFSLEELDRAIAKLRRRIGEIQNLDPQLVQYDDMVVTNVERNIRETIREVFGSQSPEFHDHEYHEIYSGPMCSDDSLAERQARFAAGIAQTVTMLQGLITRLEEKRLDLVGDPTLERQEQKPRGGKMQRKVFIVHGKNHDIRNKIDLFLTKELKLETEIMEADAHAGRTLPEKFEEIAEGCCFAIFILSADDELIDKSTSKEIKRARQNVILEVGYFWGALGRRSHVAFLVENDYQMELPSDIHGLGWISITGDLAQTKLDLQKELRTAGLI